MSKPSFNYSKWDNIELSDDESDLHPNIDKDSWFRMKHRTRLEREEREDQEVKGYQQKNAEDESRIKVLSARINNINNKTSNSQEEDIEYDDLEALQVEKNDLELQVKDRKKRILDINERRSWNIDNICKVKEEKTVVNQLKNTSLHADISNVDPSKLLDDDDDNNNDSNNNNIVTDTTTDSIPIDTTNNNLPAVPPKTTTSTTTTHNKTVSVKDTVTEIPRGAEPAASMKRERLAVISYNDYVISQEALLEKYSEINDLEQTKEFLFKNCDVLLHEHAQSYMLLSCLEDEMNNKKKRMKLVCRQSQILSHIHELGVSMKRDPRDVILPFFKRLEEAPHIAGFNSAVDDFIKRIQNRAVEKRKEMDIERRKEQKQKSPTVDNYPLGPGGLDPYQVLESLPIELREAFESQDIQRLQNVLASMDPIVAKRCMKQCVDSGLWVPKDEKIFESEEGGEYEDDDEQDVNPSTTNSNSTSY